MQNYTGFIKISKKFDKTLPAHKGMFKNNKCDDGSKAEILAAKIVSDNRYWAACSYEINVQFMSTCSIGKNVLKMVLRG